MGKAARNPHRIENRCGCWHAVPLGQARVQASCLTARVTRYWLELPVTGGMCTVNSAGLHHALLLQPHLDVSALRLDGFSPVHELE